jgi:hypothetical protein
MLLVNGLQRNPCLALSEIRYRKDAGISDDTSRFGIGARNVLMPGYGRYGNSASRSSGRVSRSRYVSFHGKRRIVNSV